MLSAQFIPQKLEQLHLHHPLQLFMAFMQPYRVPVVLQTCVASGRVV